MHGILSYEEQYSWNYQIFHAHLTDGNTTARVVGFDAKVHQRLCSFHERKEPVVMSNCEVKCSKYTNDLEVVVRNSCEFEKSPTKYNPSSESESEIILNEVSSLANFQKVTVRVKIVGMSDSEEVKGLVKQEYFIADSSAFCKIIAWEENVGVFSNGSSYNYVE